MKLALKYTQIQYNKNELSFIINVLYTIDIRYRERDSYTSGQPEAQETAH